MERVNVLPNERVGIKDYEDGAGGRLVQLDQVREVRMWKLPAGKSSNTAVTQARILGGFDIASTSGTNMTINRGRAILPFIDDDNELKFGMVFGEEGVASITLDFSLSTPSTTQAIYLRAVTTQATFQNRVFWNPSGAPAREFVDHIATRKLVAWELVIQEVSVAPPGNGEYVKIYETLLNGSSEPTTTTDLRHFYYEGDAGASPTAFPDEWGSAGDRSAMRELAAVTDHYTWAQACRRQFGDILQLNRAGVNGGWYIAPAISLQQAKDKLDHYVTVDQGGIEGDYLDLPTAIAALNAANGGTIFLRSGTYNLTAAQTISKRINLVAIDHDVVIENDLGVNAFMLTYATGSEGSYIEGISLTEGMSSSEKQLLLQTNYFSAEGCVIVGEVEINSAAEAEQITFTRCKLTGAATNANSDESIHVAGGTNVAVKFDRCIIETGNVSKNDTVFLSSGTGIVTFIDCRMDFAQGSRGIYCSALALATNVVRCDINHAGPLATKPIIYYANGRDHLLADCLFSASALSAWNDSVVKADLSSSAYSITLRNNTFNFGTNVCNHTDETRAPIYLRAERINITGCRFFNIRLWTTAEAPSMDCFINLNPISHASVNECRFWSISAGGATQDSSVIGQGIGLVETGCVHITECIFDGAGKTQGDGHMVYLLAETQNNHIMGNYFFNGHWDDVLNIGGGAFVKDNEFIFSGSGANNVTRMMTVQGDASGENTNSCVQIEGNFCIHTTLAGDTAISSLAGWTQKIINNSLLDTADQNFTNQHIRANLGFVAIVNQNFVDDGISASGIVNLMIRENVTDESITSTGTTNTSVGDNLVY